MAFWFYLISVLLSLAAVIHLLIYKREPYSTLSWLLFVVSVPIAGPLLFFIFGPQRLERRAIKRKKELEKRLQYPGDPAQELDNTNAWSGKTQILPEEDANVLKLAKQISEYGVTSGNNVEILPDPSHALAAMQAAIESAKHFVHLEYYIISSDEVTKQLFENLLKAAERGVEVRILYDALGSLSLKRIYFRKLLKRGVKIAGFLPLSFLPQRLNLNFRNHRKILIVDGETAFTGGTNIGKEYLGKFTEGQWRDFTVHVQGPACQQLQDVFAKDWHFTTEEDLFQPQYYPETPKTGDSIVQVLESGPDSAFRTLHQAIFLAITSAQKEILLTTPYFIPDSAMMSALTVASLRGVEVSILLPLKSDSKLVRYASQSFYDNLLRVGASIFEYQPQILHSKMLIIDQKWTILGSANMDIRSFRLNFELNMLVYGKSLATQASQLFETDLKNSVRVELGAFLARPITHQMLENACRLLSPIL